MELRITAIIEGMTDSLAFCKEVMAATAVGLAPGDTFGAGGDGNIRLCFASSTGLLSEAMDRFEKFWLSREAGSVRA